MQLPDSLQKALEDVAKKLPPNVLRAAYQTLSDTYHRGENSAFSFSRPEQVIAYLLARMPATFAAVFEALKSLKEALFEWSCQTVLDLGAGPGTASWAALEVFPKIRSMTLLESSEEMLKKGQELASFCEATVLKEAKWIQQDLKKPFELPKADLAIFSYVLSEIDCTDLILDLYRSGVVVLIVEPGTPKGFSKILSLRGRLIQEGAQIAAPCPHHLACPKPNWCHFPARVERTKIHKFLKEGSLGYEDEKYSYLAISSLKPRSMMGRVVEKPLKLSGHVKLTLCTSEGNLEKKTISRSQKEFYKKARDVDWSSSFPNN